MLRMRSRLVFVALIAAVVLTALASSASAITYAPVDRSGPTLTVPPAALAQSLRCTSNLASAGRAPVLFVTPSLVNPDEAYFGYERAFNAMGVPYCTITVPFFTTEDIQVSAEYVVYAIRRVHARSARKVDVVGWSQGGGPEPRWALRFWPDVRPMVAKLVDLEAPNHGTVVVHMICTGGLCANAICYGTCVPAVWQQADNSNFTPALNSGQETFPGISYTNVYSHASQFVQPNLDSTGSTSLHGGGGAISNIATQDICPANVADHLAYYYDPVGYAVVIDALTHAGPADPARIDRAVCTQVSMPYLDAAEIPTHTAYLYDAIFLDRLHNEPQTTAEPPLKCYVTASCPPIHARPAREHRHIRLRLTRKKHARPSATGAPWHRRR